MKVYKNPWVSRESYFVKTCVEGTATTGYVVEFWNGKWIVEKGDIIQKMQKLCRLLQKIILT